MRELFRRQGTRGWGRAIGRGISWTAHYVSVQTSGDGRVNEADLAVPVGGRPPVDSVAIWISGQRYLWLGELIGAEHLDANEGLLALDPGIVPRWNGVGLTGVDCFEGTVRQTDRERP